MKNLPLLVFWAQFPSFQAQGEKKDNVNVSDGLFHSHRWIRHFPLTIQVDAGSHFILDVLVLLPGLSTFA
jgi:hypothetical protein